MPTTGRSALLPLGVAAGPRNRHPVRKLDDGEFIHSDPKSQSVSLHTGQASGYRPTRPIRGQALLALVFAQPVTRAHAHPPTHTHTPTHTPPKKRL